MSFFSSLIKGIPYILRSRFKWIFILFTLWLYRVDFMPADDGGVARALQIISIFGLLLLIMQKPDFNFRSLAKRKSTLALKSICWLYLLAVMSTLWAYIPTFTFFLSFQNIVLIYVLVYVFSQFIDFTSIERTFILISVFCMLLEAILIRILFSPALFIHCLPAGSTAAICFSYCIGELLAKHTICKQRKEFLRGAILLSTIVLITSTSSGANISAIVGCAVALVFSGNLFLATLLFVCVVLLYLNQDLAEQLMMFVMPGKTKEVIEIGNGRETIWDGIMAVTAQRPLLGWGYACGERVASVYLNWTLSDAHNNYLGIYGGLGIVGVSILVIHQIIALWETFAKRIKVGYVGLFCALCCATVNGYSYGFLSGKTCSITVVYFAILVLTYIYARVSSYDNKRTEQ